jgi:hypothetical protein
LVLSESVKEPPVPLTLEPLAPPLPPVPVSVEAPHANASPAAHRIDVRFLEIRLAFIKATPCRPPQAFRAKFKIVYVIQPRAPPPAAGAVRRRANILLCH